MSIFFFCYFDYQVGNSADKFVAPCRVAAAATQANTDSNILKSVSVFPPNLT